MIRNLAINLAVRISKQYFHKYVLKYPMDSLQSKAQSIYNVSREKKNLHFCCY